MWYRRQEWREVKLRSPHAPSWHAEVQAQLLLTYVNAMQTNSTLHMFRTINITIQVYFQLNSLVHKCIWSLLLHVSATIYGLPDKGHVNKYFNCTRPSCKACSLHLVETCRISKCCAVVGKQTVKLSYCTVYGYYYMQNKPFYMN